ncbi:hypothetical protein [Staphylococcus hominis]|uniref:hypothetical protein n=1 Tax=Staphylococcus hominis TaxID=1290 RepID=UPI0011A89235|nr:hypothetical protein [Staphylococcus hominis]
MFPTYSELTEKNKVLTFIESNEIYIEIISILNHHDTEEMEYWNDFINSCVEYAEIRSTWLFLSREEKLEKDELRTAIHNTVIRNLSILKRMVENRNENIEWYNRFYDDRKRIGDFACYISYIYALCTR